MYGYASEILPYIMGLLQDNNTSLSNTTNSVAPAGEENAPVSKTGKRPAPRGNAPARQSAPAARPQGLLGSSAPTPPRRPDLGSTPPAQWVDPGFIENHQQEHNAYGVKDPNFYQTISPLGTYLGRKGEGSTIRFLRSQGVGALLNTPANSPQVMRSNSPQDNLPKGPTYLSQGPNGLGASGLTPFLAQYLYGNG